MNEKLNLGVGSLPGICYRKSVIKKCPFKLLEPVK